MSEHTPTPWELFHSNGTIAIKNPRSRSSHNEIVFWTGFDATHYPKQALANAAFIVKAVNSHDALVRALQQIADGYENPNIGHEEFRVKAAHCARGALDAVGTGKD